MSQDIGTLASQAVVVVEPSTPITAAAKLMREYHVGALVVVPREQQNARPLGVITDRDLVMEVMAQDIDADLITVGDITLERLVTIDEQASIFEAVERMSSEGVRRLVVIDEQQCLSGLLSMDDVMAALAQALLRLAKVAPTEIRSERRLRPGATAEASM